MARYVMANRRAGKFTTDEKLASRASMATVLGGSFMAGASIIQENQPKRETARQGALFEAEPAEMTVKMSSLPDDVIVEPEILHYTEVSRPMDFLGVPREILDAPVVFGETQKFKVTVRGGNDPLYGAEVLLFLRALGGGGRNLTEITDQQGEAIFEFSTFYTPSGIVAVPAGGHWPMVVRGPLNGITISCPPLTPADKNLGWWHDRLGISKMNKNRGRGIRVGIVDTGVGPHPYLDHVTDVGAFIDGDSDPKGGADVHSHGSHVCGIIGGRPYDSNEYAGIASGVSLFSARVFPKDGGANQLDIANAIDELSRERRVDLINMSLGSATGSDVERDAILDALERGTLCLCAAGNSSGSVEYPAAFRESVAVSAIGLLGWGPAGSMPSTRLPLDSARFGDENLYHANFSCFGREIVCAGPGVGYVSTVPERYGLTKPYASMGGTSMASPAACAALASVLSRSKFYKTLPRNQARADVARRLLRQSCQSIGLDSKYEGQGMPQA
jgi:subtilisin family serine protease